MRLRDMFRRTPEPTETEELYCPYHSDGCWDASCADCVLDFILGRPANPYADRAWGSLDAASRRD